MKFRRNRLVNLALASLAGLALSLSAVKSQASFWQPLNHQPSFGAGVSLLLQDGSVMTQDAGTSNWYVLTPDGFGSYANGSWKALPPMPHGYAPLYFASAVMPDGKVVVLGGEYQNFSAVWTNKGAIWDPSTKSWTSIVGPWSLVGDAQCTLLNDGTFMVGNILNGATATLNFPSLTWTLGGTGKVDRNDEEGWTLLPNGKVLTVDAISAPSTEIYDPATKAWSFAGNTWARLEDPGSQELGPQVLRPDGTVIAIGATGHNAIYDTASSTWLPAVDFPKNAAGQQLDEADGPACLLPSGNVLCVGSPGVFHTPANYFEFTTGNTFTAVPNHPDAAGQSSYYMNMLMLPTGQVMVTEFSGNVQLYNPDGAPDPAWKPTITTCPTTLDSGHTYTLTGTQLNGLSQCSAYGDDSTNATNYPLVRFRNLLSGKVTYCRTFGHSTMAVATGAAPVSTNFTVPVLPPAGPALLEVVTNGIVSDAYPVTVRSTRA